MSIFMVSDEDKVLVAVLARKPFSGKKVARTIAIQTLATLSLTVKDCRRRLARAVRTANANALDNVTINRVFVSSERLYKIRHGNSN